MKPTHKNLLSLLGNLKEKGYAVFKNIVSPEDCKKCIEEME